MKVAGDALLHARIDDVWKALNDPAVLVRTIPGCERLEETGRDAYRMTVNAGVASIKGCFDGEVLITEQRRPSSFVMRASGAGAPGTVSVDVVVNLDGNGDGTTRVRYDADAVVGGTVAGVGQRVLAGVAKKTAGEFFKAVDEVLTGAAAVVIVNEPGSDAGVEPQAAAAPRTFTRPAAAPASGREFTRGAVFGAAVALLGVLVGAAVARRRD
jgi:carbon monoxide dehydrogenase subunit G